MRSDYSKENTERERTYIAIDLKSFYASVECIDRNLDPLVTNLVVADASRTEKTICLAVSPSLKSFGIPGRARLFEVVQRVEQVNTERKHKLRGKEFRAGSYNIDELRSDPTLKVDYIAARPRMALYMKYSTQIYKIYLKYVSAADIHVYSCDEVFMDVTDYLNIYKMTAHELAITIIKDVLSNTGITATAGIGTNLYLAKVAMDIVAKQMPADKDGVRIAELDEMSYRKKLWGHKPITDFWRVGSGTAKRLATMGIFTMGDLAENSEYNEDTLYKIFGVNAELLIDHAWGWEPCTIEYIKQFKPSANSLSSGQVLQREYKKDEAAIIVREMADQLALDLVAKRLITDQLVLYIGYDANSFKRSGGHDSYKGEISTDFYGREVPKHAHATVNLGIRTSAASVFIEKVLKAYDEVVDEDLMVRRINITACEVTDENDKSDDPEFEQLDLFTDYDRLTEERRAEKERLEKENALQKAALQIKDRYGKNALLKGTSFLDGATGRERNRQIGGHKA